MKILKPILLLSLLALLFSCRHTVSPLDLDFSSLTEPRARWQAYKLNNYTIEQQRVCFCIGPHGFVKLTVENGKIVAGVEVENGNDVPANQLQYFQTVDQVFDWLEQEMEREVPLAKLEVEYHPRYGYPTSIAYDYSETIADDELWISMRALEAKGEK
ncbi:MAG: hypothetical protein H6695_12360 [Deferribacteres bacterium]|nr:hypothetical protein [candidate division KSB1 bacterium]MCB9510975.1 hypothetical protein [Deferribacteres bacterium]